MSLLLAALPAPAWADHAGPLAAQWHLDADFTLGAPAEGTADSSGHGLTASTPVGMTLAPGGRFGNHLSPANVGVLQPASSALLRPARVTLVAWIRQAGAPPPLRYVAGQGDDGGGTCLGSSYALYTGTFNAPGLKFYLRTPTASPVSPTAGSGIWDGQWHMVAGVYDGAALRLYVDGAEVGTGTPAPGAAINYGLPGGDRFYFDGYPQPTCGNGDFPGGIDELRVYRRALSPTEIARLAAAPGPNPPVLVPDAVPSVQPPPDPPPPTLDELPAPILGRITNVAPVSGTVFVAVPTAATASAARSRTSQKGLTFVPLREARQIPVGSFLDTRRGVVRLRSAAGAGRTQTGDFRSGLFQVLQSRRRSARGLTDLVLKGGSFARSRCTARGRRASAGAARRLSRRRVRRLRGNARGRFRTRGRYSSATVRGTIWDTSDRCDGTLTKVRRGSVVVRDLRRRKNIVVRAGKRTRGPGGTQQLHRPAAVVALPKRRRAGRVAAGALA